MSKILVTGSSVDTGILQPLVDAGFDVHNPHHLLPEQELRRELASAVGYLLGGDEFVTATALGEADELGVIAFLGMGYESFMDASAVRARGIPITNTPDTLTDSVAEFTLGLTLDLCRRITHNGNRYRTGERGFEARRHELRSRRCGIVGLGAIGTRIADILVQGFGAEVSYYSRTRKPADEERLGIDFQPLDRLVANVDVLIVMTPGNEHTQGLVSAELLAAAQPGLLLVNTARPEVVDAAGLRQALETGTVEAAAFDGFYDDTDISTRLTDDFGDDRLLVTGHIASLTHEARAAMGSRAVRSILNVLESGTDTYLV
ncbi:MAG TPA: D-isomer specific 2-hydroxyacid dehydrogenase family protein [Jiangellaceae bacterium]